MILCLLMYLVCLRSWEWPKLYPTQEVSRPLIFILLCLLLAHLYWSCWNVSVEFYRSRSGFCGKGSIGSYRSCYVEMAILGSIEVVRLKWFYWVLKKSFCWNGYIWCNINGYIGLFWSGSVEMVVLGSIEIVLFGYLEVFLLKWLYWVLSTGSVEMVIFGCIEVLLGYFEVVLLKCFYWVVLMWFCLVL